MVLGAPVTLNDGIQQATETFVEGLRTREDVTVSGVCPSGGA
jgi:hypothetical protein